VLTTIDVVNTGGDPEARFVFRLYSEQMQRGVVTPPEESPALPRVYLPRKSVERLLAMVGPELPAVGEVLPLTFFETRRAAREEILRVENVVGGGPAATRSCGVSA
jgi:hypothetical protein